MTFNPAHHPHRRRNALTGDWVLVSPHRTQRPWQGQEESVPEDRPPHDPACCLCPGSERAGGHRNPDYDSTFVFTNDFAALVPEHVNSAETPDSLFRSSPIAGTCRVLCFSPRHNLTLAEMEPAAIEAVIAEWTNQTAELGRNYSWVQVFENKGAVMGCSNPHPHGQVWACDALPNEVAKEDRHQRAHFAENGSSLLLDYLERELQSGERIVVENDHWVALVPYWAVWPFETLLLPRRAVPRLTDLTADERSSLADAMKRLLVRCDNLFETSFPYSMGWHGAPFNDEDATPWQLHAHFYPPLLRSATVKKFMVGYEMLGEAQRDLTPEQAADRLRACSEAHYKSPATT